MKKQDVTAAIVLDFLIMLKMDHSSTWKCQSTSIQQVKCNKVDYVKRWDLMMETAFTWVPEIGLRYLIGASDAQSSLSLTHTSWI